MAIDSHRDWQKCPEQARQIVKHSASVCPVRCRKPTRRKGLSRATAMGGTF
eukprot:NODE_4367_length_681_cov_305.014377.p4 GENE.NODE_4367_length_681_cov_305.014377~~NODE_4367_length_681_cov_305.014377.p4  ORF type:complete len:51 (+),score=0.18 NODE_4367_length_681_cov_305.014377:276-428(+)